MKPILQMLACAVFVVSVFGQTTKKPVKKTPRPAPTITTPSAEPTVQPTPEPAEKEKTPTKKNERPGLQNQTQNVAIAAAKPNYFYEFSQPKFYITKILIEHDESGVGRISVMKQDWSEMESDPIRVSQAALARIRAAYEALNFLKSAESYQYEKDYSHLGVHKFKLVRDGKERETTFSWTEVKDAKTLMDEYRKLGNEYLWIFDMNVARANQPLDAPKLVDLLARYLERNEISDPAQMIPYLKTVALDERIPLIARNHATKLIAEIEKQASKTSGS